MSAFQLGESIDRRNLPNKLGVKCNASTFLFEQFQIGIWILVFFHATLFFERFFRYVHENVPSVLETVTFHFLFIFDDVLFGFFLQIFVYSSGRFQFFKLFHQFLIFSCWLIHINWSLALSDEFFIFQPFFMFFSLFLV